MFFVLLFLYCAKIFHFVMNAWLLTFILTSVRYKKNVIILKTNGININGHPL